MVIRCGSCAGRDGSGATAEVGADERVVVGGPVCFDDVLMMVNVGRGVSVRHVF